MAGFAATDEAERTEDDEAADGFTHGAGADADAAGEPGHGEMELEAAFETAMADEMRIDGAVGDGEMEAREEEVLALYPEVFEIQFFAFHGGSLKRVDSRELEVKERQSPRKKRLNTENRETGTQRARRKRKRPEKVGALGKVHGRKPVPGKEKRPDGGRGAIFYRK